MLSITALGCASPPPTERHSWTTTSAMKTGRSYHTTTLLNTGKLLVTGGYTGDSKAMFATAELYDPGTNTWEPTGSMSLPRSAHRAVRLKDGRVLVMGGCKDLRTPTSSAEIYDPATGSFTPTASMAVARVIHNASLLPDGRVLVTGGQVGWSGTIDYPKDVVATATTELFDPTTGSWKMGAPMILPRGDHSQIWLGSGRLLVTGGNTDPPRYITNWSELYDPETDQWSRTGNMAYVRLEPEMIGLADGQVLIVGGATLVRGQMVYIDSAEIYNVLSGMWTRTNNMKRRREEAQGVLLRNGTVLVSGGHEAINSDPTDTVEVFDPRRGTWTLVASMGKRRTAHTATLLPDGRVLVIGGMPAEGAPSLPHGEIYR